MQLSELFVENILLSLNSLQVTRQLDDLSFQWRHCSQVEL